MSRGSPEQARLRRALSGLEKSSLDALFLSSEHNISYLTGIRSRDSYLVVSKKKSIYFTDFRYFEEVKKALHGFAVRKMDASLLAVLLSCCRELGLKRIGFEEKVISYAQFLKFKEASGSGIEFVPAGSILEDLRLVKSAEEVSKIKTAARITMKAFEFIRGIVSPGMKEIEVAAELERFIRYNGAFSCGFDIIVASGPNSAFPHHVTSQRRLRDNEPVLIDLGVDYSGYKSDLTRTLFLGKIKSSALNIYNIILEAQRRAISKIRPGERASEIDAASRNYISEKGFGACFGHSTGHQVGLEVHEPPRLSSKDTTIIKAGMVFAVEPGIYLPGQFGIRVEDMCLVTRKGVEVISGTLDK